MLNTVDISELTVVSELQEAEAWIDDQDYENARLALSRALGLPEPVLYDDVDEDDDSLVSPAEKEDYEKQLNAIVDLQERMATGMKLIQQCNETLTAAQQKRIPYNAYIAWVERRRKLWTHWKNLRAECAVLVGENSFLWPQYFALANATLDTHGFTNDDMDCPDWVTDIDTMKVLNFDSVDDYEE